jgi:hypothetical protein
LGEAQAEIKALRFSERLREKAVEEVISSFLIFLYMLFWNFSFYLQIRCVLINLNIMLMYLQFIRIPNDNKHK